ncbi:Wzz/FepE/Etk N-terminal domain-containing protein [bacterium]|nr:Wzz/FepE/Etk N-terminal domain-containing protein [bacterium]
MSNEQYSENDEVDLRELLAALWSHKILLIIIIIAAVTIAGYQALNAKKLYSAKASFRIENGQSGNISLSGELGLLASLAGVKSGVANDIGILLEQVTGREFILQISKELSLASDPLFNNYQSSRPEPPWKAAIKKLIGYKSIQAQPDAIIKENIINNFKSFVDLRSSKSGTVSIIVTLIDPKAAAQYANAIMEQIQILIEYENEQTSEQRLSYLSETLADALEEMERAQLNLTDYALNNSTAAQENFLVGSFKLDNLRMETRDAQKIFNILNVIKELIKENNLNDASYEDLRRNYPLVDDVNFRRILGMSESISAWSWPNIETILAVSITLRDRINRLGVEIKDIEDNAKIYASSAEDLAKLTRDAKIAEATYTVIIEQVKSQSLAAGFKPDTFKVFEYATAPISPSSPNRNFLLAVGASIGFLVGCFVVFLNATRRSVFYTKSSLISKAGANLSLKSTSFLRVAKLSPDKISAQLSKKRISEIFEADIMLANKKLVYVIDSGGRPTSSATARLLATNSFFSGRNVILYDTLAQSIREIDENSKKDFSGTVINYSEKNYDTLLNCRDNNDLSFFNSPNFSRSIKKLISDYDQVFICASKKNYRVGLMALKGFEVSTVLLANLRKTNKLDIKKIRENQSIDILFYD